jgi:hypothetical protein
MLEIKLSQGAKPGHGGILPAARLTEEIAETRHNNGLCLSLMLWLVITTACTTTVERVQPDSDATSCHIIYDAGSSATRLFVYQETATGWSKHKGPETDALADPVRRNRGKSMSDANTVIGGMLIALDNMRRDGPSDKNGELEWAAFNWQKHCNIESAAVYATAGMRLAEKQDARNSALLWKKLNSRLSEKLEMRVTTRTLTDYEEGLYSWLALRELRADGDFGVAEMGGASLQVTFPCPFCETATRVRVKDQTVTVYGHSFLGWGQDEAWRKFRNSSACAWGAGLKNPNWQADDCEAAMVEFAETAADVTSMVKDSGSMRWYLTSAFSYMQSTDIDYFCRKGINGGFEPESSCFRAVYLQNVIDSLALPIEYELSNVNWTLGAVVCTATRCLETQ